MKGKTIRLAMAVFSLFMCGAAFAQSATIGSVASEATTASAPSIINLILGIAYLAGAIFGIRAALFFKEHNDNPHQVKISKPITALVVASCLLTLPSFLSSIQDTLTTAVSCWNAPGSSAEISSVNNSCVSAGSASPNAATDLSGMFVAFSTSLPALLFALTVAARIVGLFLMIKTLYMLPHLQQGRETPSKIIWTLIAGVGIWTFPTMTDTVLTTMGAATSASADMSANPLLGRYKAASGSDFNAAIQAVLLFVQFLGAVAFFRGMLILKALGENKDGAMGRALTHIFGGAAALNITWSVAVLAKSIGASAQICGIASVLCAFS